MEACSKTRSAPTTVPLGTHGEIRMAGTRMPRRSKWKEKFKRVSAGPADTLLNFSFHFDRLGIRVPAILISPWVPKGTVVGADRVFEHASIPATATNHFIGNYDARTPREKSAQTFLDLLSLDTMRTDSLIFNI